MQRYLVVRAETYLLETMTRRGKNNLDFYDDEMLASGSGNVESESPTHFKRNFNNNVVSNPIGQISVGRVGLRTQGVDPILVGAFVLLLGVSVLMVFSTTAIISQEVYGDSGRMVRAHLVHVVIAIISMFLLSRVDVETIYKLAPTLFGIIFISLVLTLIPGIGHIAGGARRWIVLGPIRFQPGEFAKLGALFYFSWYIGRFHERMDSFIFGVGIPGLLLGAIGALLLAEPDFGTTVVVALVLFSQLLLSARLSHLALLGSGALGAIFLLVLHSPYRLRRFAAFLDPFHDPSSSGYQLIQSLIAVGTGGLNGRGLGAGRQKLFYLPAAHTDFIFAVISEELGILGASFVLMLFMVILVRGVRITKVLISDPYLTSLAIGATSLIVLPALLNIWLLESAGLNIIDELLV